MLQNRQIRAASNGTLSLLHASFCRAKYLNRVGWDESTAGERQPRVSLWEIEPLTTFPMYPSLFPLRLKRPWHPGQSSIYDNRVEPTGGFTWLRGGTGEQGLHSLNLQSVGLFPWIQQRLDLTLLANDHNQQYQTMLATGLQNLGSGDPLRHQFFQLQQPLPYLQQPGSHNSELLLQQQQQLATQQPLPHNLLQAQTQILNENLSWHHLQHQLNNQPKEQAQQQDLTYQNSVKIQNDQVQQWQQSNIPSPSFRKTDLMDSNTKLTAPISPNQNMLASTCPASGGNVLSFSRSGQSMLAEQLPQQSWAPRHAHSQINAFAESLSFPPAYSGKDPVVEPESCNSDAQNPILLGVNVDSSGLLVPPTVPSFTTSIDADVSSPLTDSGFQNSLYGCMQDSSELLHGTRQVDPSAPTRTFVKVYKSGSIGRSLDISRFSSYHELREELAQMFGIEGKLEDPFRSGWQLVFVDRENDVLLLGDDPWEAFVNNVWYIKILSPEDVQKMGEHGAGSFSQNSGQG